MSIQEQAKKFEASVHSSIDTGARYIDRYRRAIPSVATAVGLLWLLSSFGATDAQAVSKDTQPSTPNSDHKIGSVAPLPSLDLLPTVNLLPTELPPHITYHSKTAESIIPNSDTTVIRHLSKGDILLVFAQRLNILGNRYDINPEQNPDASMVVAVGAAEDIDISYRLISGSTAWQAIESSPRSSLNFVDDIQTAGRVQVTRAGIPGNCVPEGCRTVRLIGALGHRADDGNVVFDALPDETFTLR